MHCYAFIKRKEKLFSRKDNSSTYENSETTKIVQVSQNSIIFVRGINFFKSMQYYAVSDVKIYRH